MFTAKYMSVAAISMRMMCNWLFRWMDGWMDGKDVVSVYIYIFFPSPHHIVVFAHHAAPRDPNTYLCQACLEHGSVLNVLVVEAAQVAANDGRQLPAKVRDQ